MRKRLLILLVAAVIFCSSNGTGAADISKIPTISARFAYKNFQSGKGMIAEAMAPESYEKLHLLGAVNIPANGPGDVTALKQSGLPISKDQDVYVYCG